MIVKSLDSFYSFFKPNKPLLAIDYGEKRLGFAISTPNHKIAIPHSILITNNDSKKLHYIIDFTIKHNICAIIVGLPKNMNGTESCQTKKVSDFVNKLEKKTNLSIYLQDERLTSKAADVFLKFIGLNRKKRTIVNDMTAASMILETILESVKKL